jgi:hypothetical protein
MKDHVGERRLGLLGDPNSPGAVPGEVTGDASVLERWASSRTRPVLTTPPPKRPRAKGQSRPRLSSRHVILFFAANPSGTTRLALDEECAAIERELRMTPGRDDFDFRSKWAVSVDEMMRYLNEWQPAVVHFSGHGSGTGACAEDPSGLPRDVELARGTGIYLQDERRLQHVTGPALTKMIASAAPSARVVVLNACWSDAVAASLRHAVDCVVSMNGEVGDDAARSFAVSFYRALGNGRSVGNAIAQSVATLAAKQLPDEHLPVCRTRDGINADEIFLPTSGLRR